MGKRNYECWCHWGFLIGYSLATRLKETELDMKFSNFENDYNSLSSNKKGFNTHPKCFA